MGGKVRPKPGGARRASRRRVAETWAKKVHWRNTSVFWRNTAVPVPNTAKADLSDRIQRTFGCIRPGQSGRKGSWHLQSEPPRPRQQRVARTRSWARAGTTSCVAAGSPPMVMVAVALPGWQWRCPLAPDGDGRAQAPAPDGMRVPSRSDSVHRVESVERCHSRSGFGPSHAPSPGRSPRDCPWP